MRRGGEGGSTALLQDRVERDGGKGLLGEGWGDKVLMSDGMGCIDE